MGEWAARLGLLAASALVTLVFLEIALRLLGVGAPAALEEDDDGFTFFTHHPRLGWDLVPGARDRHTTDEFDVVLEISPQGLRESRVYPPTPEPGRARVVVLGDSFTFGHGVEEAAGWSARVEEALASWRGGVDVVNLAVTGYGTDQQLLRLRERGADFAPDLVVLAIFEGNVFRNHRTDYLGYPKPKFRINLNGLDDALLELTNVPVPERLIDDRSLVERTRLWSLVGARGVDLVEHLGYGEAWPLTQAIVANLYSTARRQGASFVAVLIPKDQAVEGTGLRRRLHEVTLAEIRGLFAFFEIPVLDLTPALVEAAGVDGPLYFAQDGHWTPAGHAAAAEAATPFLRRHLEDLAEDPAEDSAEDPAERETLGTQDSR